MIGKPLALAKARLEQQPLKPVLIYKPAKAGQRLDIVRGQIPSSGTLSSFDEVKLVLAKPLHGVVPSVVGLNPAEARARIARLHMRVALRGDAVPANSYSARIVKQTPHAGVAAALGLRVTLVVRAGSGIASRRGHTARAARQPG